MKKNNYYYILLIGLFFSSITIIAASGVKENVEAKEPVRVTEPKKKLLKPKKAVPISNTPALVYKTPKLLRVNRKPIMMRNNVTKRTRPALSFVDAASIANDFVSQQLSSEHYIRSFNLSFNRELNINEYLFDTYPRVIEKVMEEETGELKRARIIYAIQMDGVVVSIAEFIE